MRYFVYSILVFCLLAGSQVANAAYSPPASNIGWPQWGRDWYNSHYQTREKSLTTANVNQLRARCTFDPAKSMWGQPTTVGDRYLYFTSADACLYSIDRFNCSLIWMFNVSTFLHSGAVTINPMSVGIIQFDSRSSPAVYGDSVFIGTRAGAYLVALNRYDGTVLWNTQVDTHPLAQITMSPVVDDSGRVLIGVSSNEELATSRVAGYVCCTFQGSLNAFSSSTGARLWRTLMLPDNQGQLGGWAGAAIWGSAVAIDTKEDIVYVAVGNLYRGPDSVEQCRNLTSDQTTVTANGIDYKLSDYQQRDPCRLESGNGLCGDCSESIVAIRLADGFVEWSSSKDDVDSYVVACGLHIGSINIPRNPDLCPQTPGPDYDFGQAPIFVPGGGNRTPAARDTVYAGQKSGIIWANSARSGQNFWSSVVSAGGKFGGLQWGSASDGIRYYYSATNSDRQNMTITYQGQQMTIDYASFGAVDIFNGAILWQTPSPSQGTGQSTLAVANGIVFIGGRDGLGFVYALDASNGNVLWNASNGMNSQMAITLPGDGSVITVGGYGGSTGRLTVYTLPTFVARAARSSFLQAGWLWLIVACTSMILYAQM